MNRSGKILLGLAVGLTLSAVARADDLAAADNPYAPVVVRNVFGLNPPAPPAPPAPADPPPKITPNGIMSIFGTLQALFKVTVNVPGQPAKDQSYMLSEGQREDDIEVTKIDEKNAIITFNNHGTIQELPLVAGTASSGAAPAPGVPAMAGMPIPPGLPGNRFGGNAAAIAFRNRALNNNGYNNNMPGSSSPSGFGGGYGNNNSGQSSQETMSPEAQIIMMEANRVNTQDLVNQGKLPPLPPTPLTPSDATGNNGVPLIQLPPLPGQQ